MTAPALPPFDTFVFSHRGVDGRRVTLGYAMTAPSGARAEFEEAFDLPETLGALAGADEPAIAPLLLGLHLACGTSYWKAALPRKAVVHGAALDAEDAAFWNRVYTLGLGEFFYRNGIDPTDRAPFAPSGAPAATASARRPSGPALVLWGGGKDSAVSHEVLRQAGEPHELISVGRDAWTWPRRAAEAAGAPLHLVERRIDPRLFQLNAAGALNGHVPVSAILAFAGALVAALCGRPSVIASNEASASFGNTTWHGIDVNHQWSKSLEFERAARAFLRRHVAGGPEYVSLLRPLSELRIMKAFATHPGYFGAVTSCNANFRQDGEAPRRFCLACPKCVFVSLMARPWLDDAAYHALFGGDALADPANATAMEELLGLRGTKPFECVGTPEETLAAMHLARRRGHVLPHGAMTLFARACEAGGPDLDALEARALARGDDHELSATRLEQLDAYLARH